MKILYLIMMVELFGFASCKQNRSQEIKISKKEALVCNKKFGFKGIKFSNDVFPLFYFINSNDFEIDNKLLEINYKKKFDSIYEIIDRELKIIDYESQLKADDKEYFNQIKKKFTQSGLGSLDILCVTSEMDLKSKAVGNFGFRRMQILYWRKYEELLIYDYILKKNFPRWGEDEDIY